MIKTVSAGGIVLNPDNQVLVVNQNGNSWSLPKGHIDPGEDSMQAARREIREESGVTKLKLIKELGTYQRHRIGIDGKEDTSELKDIVIFLFTTDETELAPEDPDNPEARWVEAGTVEDLLTHPKDKKFYADVLAEVMQYIKTR